MGSGVGVGVGVTVGIGVGVGVTAGGRPLRVSVKSPVSPAVKVDTSMVYVPTVRLSDTPESVLDARLNSALSWSSFSATTVPSRPAPSRRNRYVSTLDSAAMVMSAASARVKV